MLKPLDELHIVQISGAQWNEYTTPECIELWDCQTIDLWKEWKCKFTLAPCFITFH